MPIGQELARKGDNVDLLLLHHTYDRLPLSQRHWRGELTNCVVHYVQQMHVYGPVGQRRYFRSTQLLAVSLRAAVALAHAAMRQRPEVIHVCKPQPINGLAGLLASRLLDCPLYVDCDDYEAGGNRFGASWQRTVVRLWEDWLPRYADGVTVNTRFLQQRYQSLGVSSARIAYVPNGIAEQRLLPPPSRSVAGLRAALGIGSEPVLLYVGTLSQVTHDVGLLLDAFALVVSALPSARLVLVGDGEDRDHLQRRAQEPDYRGRVMFVGAVPYERIPVFFGLAAGSVDPVADDAVARARSPLKIVESLAAGVPIVTGDVGDRGAMLAWGKAGVLVRPGNAKALADGLTTLLTASDAQRDAWVEGAKSQAKHYCWTSLAERWRALYNFDHSWRSHILNN